MYEYMKGIYRDNAKHGKENLENSINSTLDWLLVWGKVELGCDSGDTWQWLLFQGFGNVWQLSLPCLCEVKDARSRPYIGDLPSHGRLIMSRLADYFAIVGYDNKNDRKKRRVEQKGVEWAAGVCRDGRLLEGQGGREEGLSCHLVSLGHPSWPPHL